jgi:hypothetical protein
MEDEDEDNADGDGDDEVVEGGADDEDGADGADVFIMLRKKLCGILRFVSLGLLPGADELFASSRRYVAKKKKSQDTVLRPPRY